ncbi:hypothetical protein J2S00_002915 [Caldalkalibacillus uzonensis]|uniref:Copper chaperone PCu(A)C n=1 Tax=Caldalkalibacillus uzonensis TaxID=353224 RepID=A0ABU0CUL4_9BACI|nr:hypothetical protein [Caldalkalibacillus uzonensis]MDQ0340120.1 hypothetical protein [Caldalkalibacillus uzonensis]
MNKWYTIIFACLCIGSLVACNNDVNDTDSQMTADIDTAEISEAETESTVSETTDESTEQAEGIAHHDHLPYEWSASYQLEEGVYTLLFNDNQNGDESMRIAFIRQNSNIKDVEHHAAHIMEEDQGVELIVDGGTFEAKHEFAYNLQLNQEGSTSFTFTIAEAGSYAIFLEHHIDEVAMQVMNESNAEIEAVNPKEYEGHGHDHSH